MTNLMESYYYIRDARRDYELLLKQFASYSNKKPLWENDFTYYSKDTDQQLKDLYLAYRLSRFNNIYDETELFLSVLRWSHEILLYVDQIDYDGKEKATSIIDFCQKYKSTVNCRLHAVVLTEALLSLGYPARLICCLPIDVLPYDDHAITTVYSRTLNKWIALDSARNCYFSSKTIRFLSIAEIRDYLIGNKQINFHYLHRFQNVQKQNDLVQYDDDWYLDYLYKNFFRFYCNVHNGTTCEVPQVFYHLVPLNYTESNTERLFSDPKYPTRIIRYTDNSNHFWASPISRKDLS